MFNFLFSHFQFPIPHSLFPIPRFSNIHGIARQRNCLFLHADRNEFPVRRLYCILKVARYIYLTEF